MSQFEWHTEDHLEADDFGTPQPPNKRRWLLPLLIVVLLAATAFAVVDRVRRTVDTATTQTEADVRASFALVFEAAAGGDLELFTTLLSGRDRVWTVAQQQMVVSGTLLDRPALELYALDDTPQIQQVALNPTLSTAEVTATVRYTSPIETQPLTFVLPFHMRRGELNWLYAPPEAGDWGGEANLNGDYFTIFYPVRDEQIMMRLNDDFERLARQICGQQQSGCPQKLQRPVIFSTLPQTLVERPVFEGISSGEALLLPTPSLAGLPTDEQAYQALLHGYAKQILALLMAQISGYDCCAHVAYYEALVDAQLAQLGLPAARPGQQHYAELMNATRRFDVRLFGWMQQEYDQISPQLRRRVRAVVHALPMDERNSLVLLHALHDFVDFVDFMEFALDSDLPRFSTRDVEVAAVLESRAQDRWLQLIENQPLPHSPPDADLVRACATATGAGQLVRYDWPTAAWQPLDDLPVRARAVRSLPDHSGLWIDLAWQSFAPTSTLRVPGYAIWQGEVITRGVGFSSGVGGHGQRMMAVKSTARANVRDWQPAVLDASTCASGHCDVTLLSGWPHFSPEGGYVVDDRYFYSADNQLIEQRDEVYRFAGWLDGRRYLWHDLGGNIYLGTVGGDSQLWLDHDQYRKVASAEIGLRLVSVLPDPLDEQQLFLTLEPDRGDDGEWHTLQINRQSGSVHELAMSYDIFAQPVVASPYLLLAQSRDHGTASVIFDLRSDNAFRLDANAPLFFTSATAPDDDRWLLLGRDGRPGIYAVSAPGAGFSYALPAPDARCTNVVWLDRDKIE